MGKRKRGEADDVEISAASTANMNGTVATTNSSSTARSSRPTRSSSLSNSPVRPLPTARAVFGLAGSPPKREKANEDGDAASKSVDNSIGDASSKKRRVLDEDEPERVYCGDASDLPESMTSMKLSA
jgi:hypothetical protein